MKLDKLRCTKSKVSYTEALAKERDQLRAKLRKVTIERDELREALHLNNSVSDAATQ